VSVGISEPFADQLLDRVDWYCDGLAAKSGSRRWATPGELHQAILPTVVQTPALDLIDRELVALVDGTSGVDRLAIFMPPQEGKSERVSHAFVLWLLQQNQDLRVAIVSYADEMARRHGAAIKTDAQTFNGADGELDLGIRLREDSRAAGRWQIHGHPGGVYCVGIAGSLTGKPVDVLVIDDPLKDLEQAQSETYRQRAMNFWRAVAIPRLAPGAKVVLIQTRWHQADMGGQLLAEEPDKWRVVSIPAIADHDPAKGEVDALGREPGEAMVSARGERDWDGIARSVGSQVWNALYQQRPSPAEGGVLKRGWWRTYEQPPWVERDDGTRYVPGDGRIVMSWDMAFKDTQASDYVVGQVWLKRQADAYLLDQVRARLDFTATQAKVRELAARWPQASAKYVEDKANGTAILNSLARILPGLIPVNPEGSKEARAAAVSPFIEAGNVHLPSPEIAAWVGDFIEECAAFPNAAHDDQVDAMSQALDRLYLHGSTVEDYLNQLAPPCPTCGTPIPPSAAGHCPNCPRPSSMEDRLAELVAPLAG
jgi:predicted phage terminase large subunit-like protein